jgi:hypothetical protein
MKAFVLLFILLVSCTNNIHYDYNSKVVEDYSEHFRTLDSIEQEEKKALYILDSIEEAKNDSIYK